MKKINYHLIFIKMNEKALKVRVIST